MATHYPIHRVLGSNPRKGTQMVSVRWGTKMVTRHLVQGRGRHPDDTIPALHDRLNKQVMEAGEDVNTLNIFIATATKAIEQNTKEADKMRKALPALTAARFLAVAALLQATDVRDAVLAEDPLFVDYVDVGLVSGQ